MERRHLLVEPLRQDIDLVAVIGVVLPELDLGQHLVGEGRAHYEARMPRRAAQIHQPPLGEDDQPLAIGELDLVDLRLDVLPPVVPERRDLDLAVEVPDIADDRAVLHRPHMVDGDHVDIAGAGDEDVAGGRGVVHRHHLVAFHRRLEGADRVDLGHLDARPLVAERGGRALADIAEAADHGGLAGDHHVGRPLDAIDQTLAAPVEVVELGLGHRGR